MIDRRQIANKIDFFSINDTKFKHNRMSVHMILPLAKDTSTEYAILPFLMRKGFIGCEDFSKLNAMLDDLYGASLIAEVGKFGANQMLIFSIQAIDERFTLDNEKIIARCAELLCDVVLKPKIINGSFPKEDLDLERQFLIDTITAEINDKRTYAIGRCKTLMGDDNPASIKKYGYVENAKLLSPQRCAEFYKKALETANIQLTFLGSGNSNIAYKVFEDRFSNISRVPANLNQVKYFNAPEKPNEFVEKLDVSQAKLVLGFRVPFTDDSLEMTTLKLLSLVYGGTPSSKLFVNVREKLSLCYYCACRFDKLTGIAIVDSGVEFENIDRAKAEILAQLEDIKNRNISEDELNSAKLATKNSLRAVTDSLGAIEEWYLIQSFLNTDRTPIDEFELIDSVTIDMISSMARKIVLDTIYTLKGNE